MTPGKFLIHMTLAILSYPIAFIFIWVENSEYDTETDFDDVGLICLWIGGMIGVHACIKMFSLNFGIKL